MKQIFTNEKRRNVKKIIAQMSEEIYRVPVKTKQTRVVLDGGLFCRHYRYYNIGRIADEIADEMK